MISTQVVVGCGETAFDVAHVIGVVRVALDSLEDPPPVTLVEGLDLCGIKFRAPHAIDAMLSPVAVSARWRGDSEGHLTPWLISTQVSTVKMRSPPGAVFAARAPSTSRRSPK